MQTFIGTKAVWAKPMNLSDYNLYRGWDLPAEEDGSDAGYLVEYLDGGKSNHPDHQGYISWCPKEQFENANRPTNGLAFSQAFEAMRIGKVMTRSGWNGPGQYVYLFKGPRLSPGVESEHFDGASEFGDMLVLHNAQGKHFSWVPSMGDLMADDWQFA